MVSIEEKEKHFQELVKEASKKVSDLQQTHDYLKEQVKNFQHIASYFVENPEIEVDSIEPEDLELYIEQRDKEYKEKLSGQWITHDSADAHAFQEIYKLCERLGLDKMELKGHSMQTKVEIFIKKLARERFQQEKRKTVIQILQESGL